MSHTTPGRVQILWLKCYIPETLSMLMGTICTNNQKGSLSPPLLLQKNKVQTLKIIKNLLHFLVSFPENSSSWSLKTMVKFLPLASWIFPKHNFLLFYWTLKPSKLRIQWILIPLLHWWLNLNLYYSLQNISKT